MIEAQVEKKPVTTNCLHIHHFKPLIACGLSEGFRISNYESEGQIVAQMEQAIYSPSKIIFLESFSALATVSITNEVTLYIWKLKIINQQSQEENQIVLSSKSKLSFQPIAIKFNQQILALVSLSKIYIFSVAKLQIVHIFDVINNTRGLLALSLLNHPGKGVIPDSSIGVVKVVYLSNYKNSTPILAHKTQIANIAMTPNGTRFATSSVKLRCLRIFSSTSFQKLNQIKLYSTKNPSLSIQFSLHSQWMVVCTKDGYFTVFISQLSKQQSSEKTIQLMNPHSMFYLLSPVFKHFSYEMAFAESQGKLTRKVTQCTVRFDAKNDMIMAYTDALSQLNHVHFIRFDPINGGCCMVKREVILKTEIKVEVELEEVVEKQMEKINIGSEKLIEEKTIGEIMVENERVVEENKIFQE